MFSENEYQQGKDAQPHRGQDEFDIVACTVFKIVAELFIING
jgi:hypothetical protein